jgi:hypothetical protein
MIEIEQKARELKAITDIAAAVDAAYKNEIGSAKPTKARTADI